MAGYGFNTGMDGHRVRPLSEADKEEIAEGLKIIYGNARERMLRNVSGRFARGITQHGWAERKANEVLAAHAQLERDMDRAHDQREKLLSGVMEGAYDALIGKESAEDINTDSATTAKQPVSIGPQQTS